MDELTMPRTPRTIEDLGIPIGVVQDLAVRRALYEGRTSTVRLSEGLGIGLAVMSKVVEDLRDLRHIDLLGMDGRDYIFELTEQGREHARERAALCAYAGPAPVRAAASGPFRHPVRSSGTSGARPTYSTVVSTECASRSWASACSLSGTIPILAGPCMWFGRGKKSGLRMLFPPRRLTTGKCWNRANRL